MGGIDILINNAGITKDNLTIRMKEDEWKEVIDVNLNSVFLLCQLSIKSMIKNKSGNIVNITSIVGHTGNPGQANYTASKAGVVAMTKSLAREYAKMSATNLVWRDIQGHITSQSTLDHAVLGPLRDDEMV